MQQVATSLGRRAFPRARAATRSSTSTSIALRTQLTLALFATLPWLILGVIFLIPRETPAVSGPPVALTSTQLVPTDNGMILRLAFMDDQTRDATMNGTFHIEIQAPNGAVLNLDRTVTRDDFHALPTIGDLPARTGYELSISSSDWLAPPRSGEQADILVIAQPDGAAAVTTREITAFP
jgi:hypothetical protein